MCPMGAQELTDCMNPVLVSAVTSAIVTTLFKYFERPHPRITATNCNVHIPVGKSSDLKKEGSPVMVTNTGTGAAYNVRFAGSDCVVAHRRAPAHDLDMERDESFVESLQPGESIIINVYNWRDDGNPLIVLTHDRFPLIPWLHRIRKTYRWRLSSMPPENSLFAPIYEPESIPVWRRATGAIGPYELRARQDRLRAANQGSGKPNRRTRPR